MSAPGLAARVAVLEAAAAAADQRIAAISTGLESAMEYAGLDPVAARNAQIDATVGALVDVMVRAFEAENLPVPDALLAAYRSKAIRPSAGRHLSLVTGGAGDSEVTR